MDDKSGDKAPSPPAEPTVTGTTPAATTPVSPGVLDDDVSMLLEMKEEELSEARQKITALESTLRSLLPKAAPASSAAAAPAPAASAAAAHVSSEETLMQKEQELDEARRRIVKLQLEIESAEERVAQE